MSTPTFKPVPFILKSTVLALSFAAYSGCAENAGDTAPVFATTSFLQPENDDGPIGPVEAVDADGDIVTYALVGGSDQAAFSLEATTGRLAFLAPADFENPGDADGDNVYTIIVAADDGRGRVVEQAITVTVTDVSQLEVTVSYPPARSNIGGVPQTTVTGFVRDLEDDDVSPQDLVNVTVNGEDAAFDTSSWISVNPNFIFEEISLSK
ncbi:MAG: hypothetical protein AAF449_08260 [Myxococcota bacterium]